MTNETAASQTAATAQCVHCQASNPATCRFCKACGQFAAIPCTWCDRPALITRRYDTYTERACDLHRRYLRS